MSKRSDQAAEELRAHGLTYPGAHLKSPWPDHRDLAVDDKTFAYLSVPGKPFSLSCKLPHSNSAALLLPFTSPTRYGLGKWGWVTANIPTGRVPTDLFKAWLDESYRAQAAKKRIKELDARPRRRSRPDTSAKPVSAHEARPKSPLSRLGLRDRAKLFENLNYLNEREFRGFCRQHDIPYKILSESADGGHRTTRDCDRKPIVLDRIRHYLRTGERLPATVIAARIIRADDPPRRIRPAARIYYRWYNRRHRSVLQALEELTDGRFKDGAVARVLIMGFWTAGQAPTFGQFAKAWLSAKENEADLLTPEYAYLTDLKKKSTGPDWKKERTRRARAALDVLDTLAY